MRRFVGSQRSVPILFGIVTIIAYGLLLPTIGFYWDDWPFAWIARFLGPSEFIPAFLTFRPFLGPIFFLTTSLVPPVPLYWQILALVIRFVLTVSAWWMFRSIWPERPQQALAASLLFLVFPGYSQHWVALTHINQELIPLTAYLFSFGFTARAVRGESRLVSSLAAVLLQLIGLFSTEYFFALEFMRPLFILSMFPTIPFLKRAARAFRIWLPYFLIWLLNAAWLVFYYRAGPYTSYELSVVQAPSLSDLIIQLADAVWKAGLYVWMQILVLLKESGPSPTSVATIVIAAAAFALLLAWLMRLRPEEPPGASSAAPLLVLGAAGILLGRIPSLAAGLPLRLQSSYDRLMVSMMLGGSLFALGMLMLVLRRHRHLVVAVSLVAALGVGQQFFNANTFRRDWQKQGEIYRQLAWRIPGLAPGTLLLTHQMPIDYETDLSFTAPINWMYAPDFKPPTLPYALLYTEKRLGGPTLPELEPGIEIRVPYRTVEFSGNTSRAVAFFVPENGCLRVLDPAFGDEETYARESRFLVQAIKISRPDLIRPEATPGATPPFFSEGERSWCYYYAKAELARQQALWEEAAALGEQAAAAGYGPEDPVEWLPFIEAQARVGDVASALERTRTVVAVEPKLRIGLCSLWRRVQDSLGEEAFADQLDEVLGELRCTE